MKRYWWIRGVGERKTERIYKRVKGGYKKDKGGVRERGKFFHRGTRCPEKLQLQEWNEGLQGFCGPHTQRIQLGKDTTKENEGKEQIHAVSATHAE